MAKRRMFSLDIIDTDHFLEMPQSSRLLYYELCMRADDDGFISSPRKIQRTVGCTDDDFKVLITKKFIIPFETGIIVITHWKIHNYLRSDRYKETLYLNEKNHLTQDENGAYQIIDTNGIPQVEQMDTQDRIGKESKDKNSKVKESKNISLTTPAEQDENEKIPFKEIIEYLNLVTHAHYKPSTEKTKRLIRARYKDGYRLDDFKKVIDTKYAEWFGTKWEIYLRPETLFGTKFEWYLNQKERKESKGEVMDTLEAIYNGTISIR